MKTFDTDQPTVLNHAYDSLKTRRVAHFKWRTGAGGDGATGIVKSIEYLGKTSGQPHWRIGIEEPKP
jgi:hypothetical protein